MPDPSTFYTDPSNQGGVSYSDLDNKYLNLSGVNRYPRQFRLIAGTEYKPGLCSQESNRDGLYFPAIGTVGLTAIDGKTCWFSRLSMQVFDTFGDDTELVFAPPGGGNQLTMPVRTGSLALREDVVAEQLAGTKDGVNTTFTTTHNYSQVLDVIHLGVADRTFTQTAGTNSITYTDTPIPGGGERLKVIYIRD